MPEIDPDLARLLALVGLLLIALLLVAMLVSLVRLRRSLEALASDLRTQASWQAVSELPGTMADEGPAEPVPAEAAEPAATGEPSPAAASPQAAAPEVAPAQVGAGDVAAEEEPASSRPGDAPEPAPARAAEAPGETEPQEQPFERDGRWWFRRGEELLIYDERTGRWDPVPRESAPSTRIPPAAEPQERTGASPATTHGFWKCRSCGAVNGSTATTCRMCFAARP